MKAGEAQVVIDGKVIDVVDFGWTYEPTEPVEPRVWPDLSHGVPMFIDITLRGTVGWWVDAAFDWYLGLPFRTRRTSVPGCIFAAQVIR